MGVEHGLFCHKCQEWIDGHKCWGAYFGAGPGAPGWKESEKADVDRPPTYEEIKQDQTHVDLWRYWNMRMFWFLYHHKDHGSEVDWVTDSDDRYYDLIEKYKEVHRNKE